MKWGLAIGIGRPRLNKYNDKNGIITTPKTFLETTQGFDDSMAFGQSDSATIQVDVFDISRRF